jgi:non-ribosomal peptide synthetase component E (peptide arylation enzyme)
VVVAARPGRRVSLRSIIEYLRLLDVATFKLPEQLREVADLPRNALGKVQRRDLPQLFAADSR